MDRFNAQEELEYHPEALSKGRLARLDGHDIKSNPFPVGSWLWKSFNAGWADVDIDPDAPKAVIRPWPYF